MTDEIYKKDECTIMVDTDKKRVWAWVNGIAYYILPTEFDMFRFDPQRALMKMLHGVNKGITRCSKCSWEGKREEFHNGEMAELLCDACHAEMVEKIKGEGNCLKCGAPRSRCCC